MVRTKIIHTSGIKKKKRKMFKSSFNLGSHIELNTQNPNPIFEIKTYCTKYSKIAKILSMCWKMLEDFETVLKFQSFILLYI